MAKDAGFDGSKLILFIGEQLVILERDHTPGIPWPGYLDLPGGGREGDESPEHCALRETGEEIGLWLNPDDLVWSRALDRDIGRIWFFAARLPADAETRIVFGNEGLGWRLMPAPEVIADPMMIPHFSDHVRHYLGNGAPPHPRVACRTPAPGKDGVTRIPLWKFALIERNIRAVLAEAGAQGMLFGDLSQAVAERLRPEERAALGSVGWHVTTVKLEMEMRGALRRLDGRGPQRIVLSTQ